MAQKNVLPRGASVTDYYNIYTNGICQIGDNNTNILTNFTPNTDSASLGVKGNINCVGISTDVSGSSTGTYYSNSCTALRIPADTSFNRPPTGLPGYIRYNTDTNEVEYYNGGNSSWENIASATPNLQQVLDTNNTANLQTITLNNTPNQSSTTISGVTSYLQSFTNFIPSVSPFTSASSTTSIGKQELREQLFIANGVPNIYHDARLEINGDPSVDATTLKSQMVLRDDNTISSTKSVTTTHRTDGITQVNTGATTSDYSISVDNNLNITAGSDCNITSTNGDINLDTPNGVVNFNGVPYPISYTLTDVLTAGNDADDPLTLVIRNTTLSTATTLFGNEIDIEIDDGINPPQLSAFTYNGLSHTGNALGNNFTIGTDQQLLLTSDNLNMSATALTIPAIGQPITAQLNQDGLTMIDTTNGWNSWYRKSTAFVSNLAGTIYTYITNTGVQITDLTTTTTLSATGVTSGASSATWATILAGGGGGTLQSVLTAGNTATGANATIGLTNSGVGYTSNPQLTLNNSNATAGATTGVPSVDYYKSGRLGVATDLISAQNFYANNYAGTKTLFSKIEGSIRNTALGNDDGAIGMFATLNGVLNEFFRFNGADGENNSFYPLDMNNQAIKSSSGNLTLSSTSSTGTGDITASAKGAVTLTAVSGSTTLPVNSLVLSSGNTITLTNGNEANGLPENIIQMTSATTGLNNQIAMEVNDDSSSVYSRFFFGLQGSQFSICEGGGSGDNTNVWDIPANNTGNITLYRNLDFTFGSVMSGYKGVLEKSLINSTATGTLDITTNRFNTTILTPNSGGMAVNIATPMVVGEWWGICNKSIVGSIDIKLNGVSQVIFTNSNALLGSTIRVGASSTTTLYII